MATVCASASARHVSAPWLMRNPMSYNVRTMTNSDLDRLGALHDELRAITAATADAVAAVISERAPETDAAEIAMLTLIRDLRDEKVSWDEIAGAAGFVSAAATKVWYQRARQRHGQFEPATPPASLDDEGTLSADEAAKALGIPTPTFRDRYKRGDAETLSKVVGVESWHKGKRATRYRLVG